MERPSHNIPALSLQSGARRFGGVGLSVLAQASLVALLIGGIVEHVNVVPPPPPLEVTKVDENHRAPPPPPIKVERPAMPTAVQPLIDIAPEPGGGGITTVMPQPLQTAPVVMRQPPPVTVPDRAVAAIPQTHTAPPYPTLARRMGAEGTVTLRLTVLPDGTVAKAEVTASSGRQDLDQAAAQWIIGHWTYRPAIRDGAPATAQVLAAVQFSLSSAQ